jgi:hypothetical protein
MLPDAEPPQLLKSRLTCEGGGATTVGVGKVNLALADVSRCGAETGGATTLAVCVSDDRELARSRWASVGAGAMTEGLIWVALRILSRVTSGAGATTDALSEGIERVWEWETSGAGAIRLAVRLSDLRVRAEFNSGVGGTT